MLDLASKEAVYRYIIDHSRAYYNAVDIVEEGADASATLSSFDGDPYYNYVIHKNGDLAASMEKYWGLFEKYGREPMIYISPASEYYGKELELEKFATDAFMFFEDETPLKNFQIPADVKVEVTENEEEFIKVWAAAHSDPGDLYGIASDVEIDGMRRFFAPPPAGFNHFATAAYKNGVPVANVVSVYNKDFLLITGFCVVPEHRGQGLGIALIKDIVKRAHELGVPAVTLQTEAGSRTEEYYARRGFVSRFTGAYYRLRHQ